MNCPDINICELCAQKRDLPTGSDTRKLTSFTEDSTQSVRIPYPSDILDNRSPDASVQHPPAIHDQQTNYLEPIHGTDDESLNEPLGIHQSTTDQCSPTTDQRSSATDLCSSPMTHYMTGSDNNSYTGTQPSTSQIRPLSITFMASSSSPISMSLSNTHIEQAVSSIDQSKCLYMEKESSSLLNTSAGVRAAPQPPLETSIDDVPLTESPDGSYDADGGNPIECSSSVTTYSHDQSEITPHEKTVGTDATHQSSVPVAMQPNSSHMTQPPASGQLTQFNGSSEPHNLLHSVDEQGSVKISDVCIDDMYT